MAEAKKRRSFDFDSFERCVLATIALLEESDENCWSGMSVRDMIIELRNALVEAKSECGFDRKLFSRLYGPTGPLQETAIESGWGDEYLEIAEEIDALTKDETIGEGQ